MFKRVERKRKRREEDEELGLDEDTKGIMGLNDTDSDESDSGSEDQSAQSDADIDKDMGNQEEDAASEGESVGGHPPISVAEALKDPIYFVSFNPTLYGCVLCKGKLIKNTGMATVHKNADAHKRRSKHFKLLSADADSRSDAWELVRVIHSACNVQREEARELSKRALKRQVKQATIRDKRKRHKKLKARAIAKKASQKLLTVAEARSAVPFTVNIGNSPESQIQQRKKKLTSNSTTNTITEMGIRNMATRSPPRIETSRDSKKPVLHPRLKNTRNTNKLSV